MKKFILLLLALSTSSAFAVTFTDSARVVEVRPAQERVVTRQCGAERVVSNAGSGTDSLVGTAVGSLIGAALGNQVGGGRGNTLATVAGAIGGAAIGNGVTSHSRGEVVRECEDVASYRPVGFDTTYEYRGARETIRTAYDPGVGNLIQVSVSVGPAR